MLVKYKVTMYKTSKRMQNLPISAVRKLTPYAVQAKKEGVKVFHLNIGDPDIKTPEVILNVLQNWNIETIRYAQSSGEPELIKSLKSYYHKLGFTNINEENMLITVGGSEALTMALFAVANPGDEILVFEPFYSNYASLASFCDVKLVSIPTSIEDGFHLPKKEEIVKRITSKTKAILFCSPNNPTGTIYSQDEIEMLVSIVKEKGLFLLSDEVYREFVFDGRQYTSVLDFLDQISEQIILLDSLSKRYSLCGARIGIFVSLNKEIISAVMRLAQSRLSGGLVDQLMAAKLSEVSEEYTNEVMEEYQKRRDVLYEGLSKIEGVFLTKPEGAFYTMVSLPVKSAEDFAIFLLKDFRINNETVMLAPGAGFYGTPGQGLNQVRIAYVLNVEDLKKCMHIIAEGLKIYSDKS